MNKSTIISFEEILNWESPEMTTIPRNHRRVMSFITIY